MKKKKTKKKVGKVKVLGCPWCGKKPKVYKPDDWHGFYKVECFNAMCTGGLLSSDRSDAIDAWNKRK